MPKHVGIQINHTVQTNRQQVVQNQSAKDTAVIKLVGQAQFFDLFKANSPQLSQTSAEMFLTNADLFWDHLFGNIGCFVQHGQHKKAAYLTEESAHMILKHFEKFVSGFDFYNQPRGFLMVQNPTTHIVDVLHYSSFLHDLQQTSPANFLAIAFDSQEPDSAQAHPFEGEQKNWYEALQTKCLLDNGQITCTEQELRSAFIRFLQIIEEFGLTFYRPNFGAEFFSKPINPVVLLARFATILRNRHLKIADRKVQWEAILDLRLEYGDEAIRALSDHEYDVNPCGILLPEMNCVKDDFLQSEDGSNFACGFRSVISFRGITEQKHFWRYIAFQPNRHSVTFYREALQAIEDITLISEDSKRGLIQMLAGGTTCLNAAQNAAEESNILTIWKEVCSIINRWETMNPVMNVLRFVVEDNEKIRMRNELVVHLTRLKEPPNIVWLNMIFGYIKHFFANAITDFDDLPLIELSNRLDSVVTLLKRDLYKGAKFICGADDWVTVGIKGYIERQNRLCDLRSPLHMLLAAHLSTFNITNEEEYIRDITFLHGDVNPENSKLLIFTLKLLEDIQTNKNLQWSNLFNICRTISTQQITTEIEVFDYLERQFHENFSENYFEEKRRQVLLAQTGLDAEQIAFIDKLNFSEEQAVAVKQILSMIKSKVPLLETAKFENLVMKFNDFTRVFTSSDVTKFLKNLSEMHSSITDLDQIEKLLELLMEKRKFTDFEHIYFRNKIVQNTQNVIVKFFCYISVIQGFVQAHPVLNPSALQSMLATYILNSDSYESDEIEMLLACLVRIIQDNPHVQDYIFMSLQNIPGNNTSAFIPNTLQFVRTLTEIHQILATDDGVPNVENMQIFYSFLAKYAKNPEFCITLLARLQLAPLEADKVKFIIHLISKLLEQNQSLESVQSTVEYIISLDVGQYRQFVPCYQNSPYPPLGMWQEWSQEPDTLLDKYTTFSSAPFGARKLRYAFDLKHYHQQKSLFNGLICNGTSFSTDIFTDELGVQLDEELSENRGKSIPELQEIFRKAFADKNKVLMLCAATELLARTTPQKDLDSPGQISQEMNTTQMMAAYATLVHPHAKLQTEMDTGEGKSRVLMVVAACQVSLGFTTDFITSDFQLAERDYFSYKSFFASLDIPTSLMTLSTPELLYRRRGVNFSDNEQLQLARNKSDIDNKPFAFLNDNPAQRCLILDEVDKFKKDKSKYACNYAAQSIKFGAFTWIYPHLVQFMLRQENSTGPLEKRSVYQNMTENFLRFLAAHDADPIRVAQISALCHIHPEQVSAWLYSADIAIKKMKLGDDYAISEKLFPIVDGEGNIRMSQNLLVLNNGRPAEGALFSDGLHQCLLAFLNIQAEREQYIIPPEVETQRTSYPIIFMGKYDEGKIIGASGTTRSGGPIANPDINYENYGYLSVPRERPLKRDHQNIWAAKDQAQQILFIKRDILKKLEQRLPILIICKNDNQSLALYNALSNDPDLEAQCTRVHGLSTPEEEKAAIKKAGLPGIITFSTAGMFSRGVDIDSDHLVVRSVYVPTLEDEIQIMGRTSRAGKPGEYGMILDMSDEDARLERHTYNIYNEVEQYQKHLAVEAEFQEAVSVVYALFLEEITQSFLNTRPGPEQAEVWLMKWQSFLNDMQKNWENYSDILLDAIENNNNNQFMEKFQHFTTVWRAKLQAVFPEASFADGHALRYKAVRIFDSAVHQPTFFKPKRHAIKVQHAYDPTDDGQARIYDTLFAQSIACLRGERLWFADYHAWREGRGALFPDLMATLNGERPLFANLIATITRWLKELKEFFNELFVESSDLERDYLPAIVKGM